MSRKRSLRKGSSNSEWNVKRNDVLRWLTEDVEWLRQKARNKCSLKNPVKVSLMRASIYGCSTILSALKDQELEDLASRVEKLEEKLGVKAS